MSDALAELAERAGRAAAEADGATLARAADCVLVALTEAAVSSRDDGHGAVAAAIRRDEGPTSMAAVAARAFLVHAGLADDAYAVAAHPGLAVVPAALAEAAAQASSGPDLLRAVVAGYEAGCVLTDVFLPRASELGWRITSIVGPPAAAAAVASLAGTDLANALRLALALAGGPLETVSGRGEDWRLQPALAAAAGVGAARAAAGGIAGTVGVLEGAQGAYAGVCRAEWPGWPPPARPRIHDVTFKRFGVAMYAQGLFDAVERLPALEGEVAAVSVRVPPFAAGYGARHASSQHSPASLPALARQALELLHPACLPPADVSVEADGTLPPHGARVQVTLADGRTVEAAGDGDTAGWTSADVDRRCLARLGDGRALLEAVRSLESGGPLDELLR